MSSRLAGKVAIVNYGMGNLFSVLHACRQVGIPAAVTSSPEAVASAGGVVLPGVGAFGTAMATLRNMGLDAAVMEAAARGTPFLGVCLGMQLLFDESQEFGGHEGLSILRGRVVSLAETPGLHPGTKVPHVGWSPVTPARPGIWANTPLDHLSPGAYQYFVHSFHTDVADAAITLSTTPYGGVELCSSVLRGRILACQFHPERSGPEGLRIYRAVFGALADGGMADGGMASSYQGGE